MTKYLVCASIITNIYKNIGHQNSLSSKCISSKDRKNRMLLGQLHVIRNLDKLCIAVKTRVMHHNRSIILLESRTPYHKPIMLRPVCLWTANKVIYHIAIGTGPSSRLRSLGVAAAVVWAFLASFSLAWSHCCISSAVHLSRSSFMFIIILISGLKAIEVLVSSRWSCYVYAG